MNKRLRKAVKGVIYAARYLEEVERDLLTRETDPTFSAAQKLFAEKWRLYGWEWRNVLRNTDYSVQLRRGGETVGHWADGKGCIFEEAYPIIGLLENAESEKVLLHLSNLTAEE